MSLRISFDIPDSSVSLCRDGVEQFARELRLAAAVKWYEMGALSQSKAAELTEMSREEFLAALHRLQVSPFQTLPEELAREIEHD